MHLRLVYRLLTAVVATASCGPARTPPSSIVTECPADGLLPDGASRFGALVIDGVIRASGFAVIRTRTEPETYEVGDPGPEAWVALDPAKISLIRFVTGPSVTSEYGVCADFVAIVVTTSP